MDTFDFKNPAGAVVNVTAEEGLTEIELDAIWGTGGVAIELEAIWGTGGVAFGEGFVTNLAHEEPIELFDAIG